MLRRILVLMLGLAGIAMAAPALGADAVIEGNVVYRERMLLPEGAVATVRLEDVSRADAPAELLGEVTVPARTSPTVFALTYDPAALKAGHSYALRASILQGDALLFTTTQRENFDRDTVQPVELLVQRVVPAAELPLAGAWLAEDILGGGVIDNLQTTLELAADGQASGNGGCNRFGGKAEIAGDRIRFASLASTMMACQEAIMGQERKFHDALERTRSYRIDANERKLYLLDAAGQVVARLVSQ